MEGGPLSCVPSGVLAGLSVPDASEVGLVLKPKVQRAKRDAHTGGIASELGCRVSCAVLATDFCPPVSLISSHLISSHLIIIR